MYFIFFCPLSLLSTKRREKEEGMEIGREGEGKREG